MSMTKGPFWCKGIERFDAPMKGPLLPADTIGVWSLHGTTINQALFTFGEWNIQNRDMTTYSGSGQCQSYA